MGRSTCISLLLIIMATLTMASDENSEAIIEYDNEPPCLNEIQYKNESSTNTMHIEGAINAVFSAIKDELMKLATKEELDNTNNTISENLQELHSRLKQADVTFAGLATKRDVDHLNDNLVNMTLDITAESKRMLNMLNGTTNNVIENVKEHLDLYNISITGELSVIRNQTLANFYSLNQTLVSLASKSEIGDIMTEMKQLATRDIIESIHENMTSQLLSCCNKTRTETLNSVQNLSKIIQPKLEGLAVKTDVETLKEKLDNHANISEVALIEIKELVKTNTRTDDLDIVQNLSKIIQPKLEGLAVKTDVETLKEKLDHLANISEVALIKIKELVKTNDKPAEIAEQHYNQSGHDAEIRAVLDNIKRELLSCHNTTKTDDLDSVQELLETIPPKFEGLAVKTDVETLKEKLDKLASKSEVEESFKEIKELMTTQGKYETGDTTGLHKNQPSAHTFETIKTDVETIKEQLDKLASKSEVEESFKEIKELMKTQGKNKAGDTTGLHKNQPSAHTFETRDIFSIFSVVALLILVVLVCIIMKRMGIMQRNLQHLQTQMLHEKYNRRDSTFQLPEHRVKKNGSVRVKPTINMYEDTELTEGLVKKDQS